MKMLTHFKAIRFLTLALTAACAVSTVFAAPSAPVFRQTPLFRPLNNLSSRVAPFRLGAVVNNIELVNEKSNAVVSQDGDKTTIAAIAGTLTITLKDGTKKTINAGSGVVINADGTNSTETLKDLLSADTSGSLKTALVEAVKDYATQVAQSAATGTNADRLKDSQELAAVITLVTQEAAKANITSIVTEVVTAATTAITTSTATGATAAEVTYALAIVTQAASQGAKAGGASDAIVNSIATTVATNSNGAVTTATLAEAATAAVVEVNAVTSGATGNTVALDAVERSGS